MELPVEHGLLLDNLLDLAHAPFTHTSTFAKGWSVPRYSYMLSINYRKLIAENAFPQP
jgi:chlorophyllide a oxygenase